MHCMQTNSVKLACRSSCTLNLFILSREIAPFARVKTHRTVHCKAQMIERLVNELLTYLLVKNMKLITDFFVATVACALVCNAAGWGSFRPTDPGPTAKRAADIVQNQVGKMVNVLKNLKTDMEIGILPLTLAPGAPGGSSDIAKFLATLWRGSRREGGLWFAPLDSDGWVGYYDGANAVRMENRR